jgi:hypothetical protein
MVASISKHTAVTRVAAVIAIAIIASSCVNTSYHDMSAAGAQDHAQTAERSVSFWLNQRVFNQLYRCVFVVPSEKPRSPLMRVAERSFERHLYEKFERVIPGHIVSRISKRKLVDLDTGKGTNNFSQTENCPLSASLEIKETKNDFVMFYARKSVNIELSIKDTATGDLLWKARHKASRGDGAIPLSPLSAISSVVRATRLSGDGEQFESIVDDAIRRMARTLPSFRFDGIEKATAERTRSN